VNVSWRAPDGRFALLSRKAPRLIFMDAYSYCKKKGTQVVLYIYTVRQLKRPHKKTAGALIENK